MSLGRKDKKLEEAAPDLLYACEQVLRVWSTSGVASDLDQNLREIIPILIQATMKAKGEPCIKSPVYVIGRD